MITEADCDRCGYAGGLDTADVDTRFDVLCLACAKKLANQPDAPAGLTEVAA